MGSISIKRIGLVGFSFLLMLHLAATAQAVDGVIEINQARAKAGGVTATDTPGFPVTIDKAGSYRLTGNLDVSNEPTPQNVSGIAITAANVTVDLNGFSIIGPTGCTDFPVSGCTPTGTGDGISADSAEEATVLNGSVIGMGRNGILLGDHARVEGVHVRNNGDDGIDVGDGSTVTGSTATANGFDGIYMGFVSVVTGNTARGNRWDGIRTGNVNTVTGNTMTSNGADGLNASSGSAVIGNSASGNGNYGLNMTILSGYANNVMSFNGIDSVNGGVQIGTNLCHGSTVCP